MIHDRRIPNESTLNAKRFPRTLLAVAVTGVLLALGCERKAEVPPPRIIEDLPQEEEAPFRPKAFAGTTIELPPADAPFQKVSARQLYEEFQDAETALAKYADCWVELSGELYGFTPTAYSYDGDVVLVANVRPPSDGTSLVNADFVPCYMAAGERPWEQGSSGDAVTLRGVVSRQHGSILLAECRIIKAGTPTLKATVDEFVELVELDPVAFKKKYDSKQAIVTGKFAGHVAPEGESEEDWPDDDAWAVLEGESGRRIHILIGLDKYMYEGYGPGDEVAVIGDFLSISSEIDLNHLLQATENVTPFVFTDE